MAGLALLIPSTLVAGPIVGLGFGWVLQKLTGWGNWIMLVCLILGFIAGARETVRIIRRIS